MSEDPRATYEPAPPRIPARNVVGSGWRQREAPRLLVRYRCPHPKCDGGELFVMDAYDGPPSCLGRTVEGGSHPATFLEAVDLVAGRVL